MIIQWLTVFFLAMLELWIAIPAGLALRVNEDIILLLTITGGITGVGIITFAGDRIRSFILKTHKEQVLQKQKSWSMKIWDKYGLIGLGVTSPFLTGAPIGAALAIALGSKPMPVFLWFSLGVIIWSFIFLKFTVIGINELGILK